MTPLVYHYPLSRGRLYQAEVDEWNTAHGYKDQNGNWQPLQPVAKPGDIRIHRDSQDWP